MFLDADVGHWEWRYVHSAHWEVEASKLMHEKYDHHHNFAQYDLPGNKVQFGKALVRMSHVPADGRVNTVLDPTIASSVDSLAIIF